MKKILFCCCGLLVATVGVRASILFSDTFSYPNGNLVGNDGWIQNSTTSTSPIQVANGVAIVGKTGQDVIDPLTTPYTPAAGTSFYIGATLNLSAAQSSGDYFIHYASSAGSTAYAARIEARSSGAGYQMGYLAQAGGAVTWGTQVLDFNKPYSFVLSYNVVSGTANDTADLFVNPTDTAVQGNNTPYLANVGWVTGITGGEVATIGTINLRQGTTGSAPTVGLDNLIVATTFAEAATFTAVPEPTSLSLLGGFALLAWYNIRRRK
jgi:hypothetical protein